MSLSIALTADPELAVPPTHYGGIERIIDMLAQGLSDRGHQVTVFANSASETAGRLAAWPGGASRSRMDTLRNATFLATETKRCKFDVVHSFSRLAYLTPILPLSVAKVMTYQRPITLGTVRLAHALSRNTLEFTAISRWMMLQVRNVGLWRVIPNGVSLNAYSFRRSVGRDAPLVFLGRVEEIKGPHLAVEVAKRTGLPLVIAGNIPTEKQTWFDAHIAPFIDGVQIRYIGPVNDAEKNTLLGEARALLMPILWDEPFGIVMTEALACGTPVIGLERGSVPEIVEDGVSGFICKDIAGMVDAVGRIDSIDRANCRRRVEREFSADGVVEQYLQTYYAHAALAGSVVSTKSKHAMVP